MAESRWSWWVERELEAITAAGRWRTVRDIDGPPSATFAANDYLGLSQHRDVRAAAHAALDRWGAGAGAARLTVGSRPVHTELEAALAAWKGSEAALVFPTGYAANLGVLATFGHGGRGVGRVRILSDALNHASIIDGCRLAGAHVDSYRHADAASVEELLAEPRTRDWHGARTILATESVFSMDGDVAPVDALVDICRRHHLLLVLDESHAVLGPHPDLTSVDYLRVGTLSKTLGSQGGFVAGPRRLIDLLVNRARPFIFTTALSPAAAAAALAALGVMRSAEGKSLMARLSGHVERVAPGHPSPIIPVVLGSEEAAMAASAALAALGLEVPAIRPPTVPIGSSRLRVTLSAAHTDAQIGTLIEGLRSVTS